MTAEEVVANASEAEKPILEVLMSFGPIMSFRQKLEAARQIATRTPSDAAVRERDALGQTIAEAAIKVGIIDGCQPLTGPQLIMLCNDLADSATSPKAESEFLDASIAVWREIDKGGPPLDSSVELRKCERAAWERYRDHLAARTK